MCCRHRSSFYKHSWSKGLPSARLLLLIISLGFCLCLLTTRQLGVWRMRQCPLCWFSPGQQLHNGLSWWFCLMLSTLIYLWVTCCMFFCILWKRLHVLLPIASGTNMTDSSPWPQQDTALFRLLLSCLWFFYYFSAACYTMQVLATRSDVLYL